MRNRNEILQKFKSVPGGLQIVCVGTTQAHFALDFSDCPVPAYNMALYLNPIPFSRLLLEKYHDRLEKGAAVLITLQYPILCIGSFRKIAEENAVQYAKLLPGRNPYISRARQLYYYLLPSCLDRQMPKFQEIKDIESRNRYVNHYKPWELEELCRHLIRYGWDEKIGITDYIVQGHKKASEKVNRAMKRAVSETLALIRYCQKQGYIPILVGLPYSGVLNRHIPDSFREKCFYRPINYIQERASCKFLDYSTDVRMQDVNNYMDVLFLNERGRKKYTQIVLEDIRRIRL